MLARRWLEHRIAADKAAYWDTLERLNQAKADLRIFELQHEVLAPSSLVARHGPNY